MTRLARITAIVVAPRPALLTESDRRIRGAALSAVGQAATKCTQIVVTVITVPLMIACLGANGFGAAMAIAGFAQWFLLDTGIAQGLQMRLIETLAQDDRRQSQAYVSTGLFALSAVSVLFAAVFFAIFPFLDWAKVFHIDAYASNLHASLVVVVVSVLLMIPLKILREVYMAAQRGYMYSLWMTLGTVGSLVGISLATRSGGGMCAVFAGMYLPVLLSVLAGCMYLFVVDMPWLQPNLSSISGKAWKQMWPESAGFLAMGISLMIINGSDIFLVNYFLGGHEASAYSLSLRIFLYIQVVVSFLTYPAWPAIGNAIQRREIGWAVKAARALFAVSLGFAIPTCVLLVVFGKRLVSCWSRGEVQADQFLLVLLAVYVLARIWCALFGIILNAMGCIRIQGITSSIEGFLHLTLGIALLHRFGAVGLAAASLISVLLTRAWVLPLATIRNTTKRPRLAVNT